MNPARRNVTTMSNARSPREKIDGVLLLDKPAGVTSNAALQTAKRLLNAMKAGHTGTLDPMATGLLPLTFGEATKFSQMLLDADKSYEATVLFGEETDTGDAEGKTIRTAPVDVSGDALATALENLRGEIEQIPPMHSALKRNGKPLYEYSRAGIEVERVARPVTIHSLECLEFDKNSARLAVRCSKGTYIRTLAIDLGRALGCGAHLTALHRTAIGAFEVEQGVGLATLEQTAPASRKNLLAPADTLVEAFPAQELNVSDARAIVQGRSLPFAGEGSGLVRLYCAGRFLGLGNVSNDGVLHAKRLIAVTTADFHPED